MKPHKKTPNPGKIKLISNKTELTEGYDLSIEEIAMYTKARK